ncbi:MAG: hypothetical protein V4646_14715, partial [Pseudomonadota bacterium]
SCNQLSLKLYTGFFITVNKKFTFCLLAEHFDHLGLTLRFGLDFRVFSKSDCNQSSLRFYTGFFIPVKTNFEICFESKAFPAKA